jgi:hypothetical protein
LVRVKEWFAQAPTELERGDWKLLHAHENGDGFFWLVLRGLG